MILNNDNLLHHCVKMSINVDYKQRSIINDQMSLFTWTTYNKTLLTQKCISHRNNSHSKTFSKQQREDSFCCTETFGF